LRTSLRKKCKLLGVPYDPECVRHVVCERDGWICQECHIECLKEWTFDRQTRQVDPRSAEHDHIIPLTATGSLGNIFPNSQCLCHACNNRKRDAARGQLRLDLERSVKRWEEGGLARNRHRSKSCVAIPVAAPSTKQSRIRPPMAL
jgi:5-methylcytosine-specific restriction endonuclease McrA